MYEGPCPTEGQWGSSSFPPSSNSCYSPEDNQIFQSFNFTNSYPMLLLWPGTEMSLGDSEMVQCKSVQWTLSMNQTGGVDGQGA